MSPESVLDLAEGIEDDGTILEGEDVDEVTGGTLHRSGFSLALAFTSHLLVSHSCRYRSKPSEHLLTAAHHLQSNDCNFAE